MAKKGRLTEKVAAYLQNIGYIPGLGKIYKGEQERLSRYENVLEFVSSVSTRGRSLPHLLVGAREEHTSELNACVAAVVDQNFFHNGARSAFGSSPPKPAESLLGSRQR